MGGRRFSSETIAVRVNIRNDCTSIKKYVKVIFKLGFGNKYNRRRKQAREEGGAVVEKS